MSDIYASSENALPPNNELLKLFDITEQDIERIASCSIIITPNIEKSVDVFYDWLLSQEYSKLYFESEDQINRLKKLQADYWIDFFKASFSDEYFEKRRKVGSVHASIDLPLDHYMSGLNKQFELLIQDPKTGLIYDQISKDDILSLYKGVHLDEMITAEAYSSIIYDEIRDKSESINAMSTPVTNIWDGILVLPLVGVIDSSRALDITSKVLSEISQQKSSYFILDISGVGIIDTSVANHLIKITKATRLMGCETMISGLSPEVANTIVDLGIDVGNVKTSISLQDSLKLAMQKMENNFN